MFSVLMISVIWLFWLFLVGFCYFVDFGFGVVFLLFGLVEFLRFWVFGFGF